MEEMILIGVMPIDEAKYFQKKAQKLDIEIYLNHESRTCSRGCGITVELWTSIKSIEIIKTLFEEEFIKMLPNDVILPTKDHGFDLNHPTSTCPACDTEFQTSLHECPECHLRFV